MLNRRSIEIKRAKNLSDQKQNDLQNPRTFLKIWKTITLLDMYICIYTCWCIRMIYIYIYVYIYIYIIYTYMHVYLPYFHIYIYIYIHQRVIFLMQFSYIKHWKNYNFKFSVTPRFTLKSSILSYVYMYMYICIHINICVYKIYVYIIPCVTIYLLHAIHDQVFDFPYGSFSSLSFVVNNNLIECKAT